MRKIGATSAAAGQIMDRILSLIGPGRAPSLHKLNELTEEALIALKADSSDIRPRSPEGEPGGLIRVTTPWTIIVPDLHARSDFLVDLLGSRHPALPATSILELILQGRVSIICLGDIPHSEGGQAAERWSHAARYAVANPDKDYLENPYIDQEMNSSLLTLALVMSLKIELGSGFYCLKGNHDNLGNLEDSGDLPFYKYAMEGVMGAGWFYSAYGVKAMEKIRRYERLLPLVACGNTYCASHAEPAFALELKDILDYGKRPDVVQALIWTGNNDALPGATAQSLKALLYPGQAKGNLASKLSSLTDSTLAGDPRWIVGHRPVCGAFSLRAGNRLVQIHNPERRHVAWVDEMTGKSMGGMYIYEIAPGQQIMRQSALIRIPLGLDHGLGRD